jgi:uncharacterized protein (DUF305 family)
VSRRALVLLLVVLTAACSASGPSDVDVGFAQDMVDHHEQAVRMALLITAMQDVSPITRSFAVDVIASQRYELGKLDAFLEDAGEERGKPQRQVMAWMDMATPLESMPGLASQASLDELARVGARDADALFFRLMVEHHRGGLHMAEYEQQHGRSSPLRELAKRIAFSQTKEIREMQLAERQLQLTP